MRILFLSVVIVAAISGISYMHYTDDTWITVTFFAFMFWPIICMILVALSGRDMGTYDQVKMQNYYNLDAIRRNSDQAARNNPPWRNKP